MTQAVSAGFREELGAGAEQNVISTNHNEVVSPNVISTNHNEVVSPKLLEEPNAPEQASRNTEMKGASFDDDLNTDDDDDKAFKNYGLARRLKVANEQISRSTKKKLAPVVHGPLTPLMIKCANDLVSKIAPGMQKEEWFAMVYHCA